jgi:hypothetical protein
MAFAEMNLLDNVDLVSKGIEKEYRELLAKRLEQVAREVAAEAAKNIVKRIQSYRRVDRDDIALFVQFGDLPLGQEPPQVPTR